MKAASFAFCAVVAGFFALGNRLAVADLLVSSEHTNQVLRYSSTTGEFLGVFASGGGLVGPRDLAFGSDGSLYVGDGYGQRNVLKYNGTTGAFIGVFTSGHTCSEVDGVVFGPDGNLYVSSTWGENQIIRFSGTTGKFMDVFVPAGAGGMNYPKQIVFGPDGNLYVSDRGDDNVVCFDGTTGAFIRDFVAERSGGLGRPVGLTFGPGGDLYVCNPGGNNILRYDGDTGEFIKVFASGGGLASPEGLTFGPDGKLYVSSGGTDSILRYNGATGAFLDDFVPSGSGGLSGPMYLIFTDQVLQRTLTISSTTGGTVTSPGIGSFEYDHGSSVAIVATPSPNYHFVGWTGTAVEAGKVGNPSAASTTVTMDADYTLQANFAIDRRTLTVSSTAGGSVSAPGVGVFEYDYASNVPITTAAEAHYHFTAWTGTAVDAGKVANPSLASTTVTVDGDYSLQANFAIDTYTLTVNATNGSVSCDPTKPAYTHGETVTLQAIPKTGYQFTGWSGDLSNNTNPVTITMDGNKTITASFSVIQRTMIVSKTAGGVISTPGEGTFRYDHGTQVTLQAEPDPLFVFAGWRGSVFSSQNPLTLTMENDCQIRAQFTSVLGVLYVDDDAPNDPGPDDPNLGDPNENGTSEHPFDSIQEAIEVAKDGTRVIVRSGTYRETIDLLGKSITVSGLGDDPNSGPIADLPIIDARGRDSVVKCIEGEDPNCILQGLVITGGKAQPAGGILCVSSSPTVVNCLIVGNRATGLNAGGAVHCQDSNAVFVNCTISNNGGGSAGAGVCFSQSNAVLSNSIAWANMPSQVQVVGSSHCVITYTDVAGGWPGAGNLDVDPRFALPGYWANPADLTKVLSATDLAAVWLPGDYHLQSQAGRWDPLTKAWVIDAATSPCIDAGDPNTPTGKEPLPNGARINLGVYGGTGQASMSSCGG